MEEGHCPRVISTWAPLGSRPVILQPKPFLSSSHPTITLSDLHCPRPSLGSLHLEPTRVPSFSLRPHFIFLCSLPCGQP